MPRNVQRAAWGMTLMEVMMTVVIIGILASMAVPQYRRSVERGYWRGSQDILQAIYTGEQVYFTINNTYVSLTTLSLPADWRKIYMDNPNVSTPMPVAFTVAGGATFTAKAARSGSARLALASCMSFSPPAGSLRCGASTRAIAANASQDCAGVRQIALNCENSR